jgi:regulator of sigma E protease
MNDFGNGLLVAFGIGLLIFLHELGHYLAARWIGARVLVFSLGFGPRVLGFRRGATDYRLSLIPLGGYVAVAGQDPGDLRFAGAESLQHKSVGQRALFFSGGVVMNLLFALIAFPIAFGSGVSFPAPVIGHVEHGGGAWEARVAAGDRVLAIDGKHVYSFENLVVEVALAGGRNVQLLLQRGEEQRSVSVRPQFRAAEGLYSIGIGAAILDRPPTLLVADGGAAAAAGLRTGDLLLAIDGVSVSDSEALTAAPLVQVEQGGAVELRVSRDGSERTVSVTPVASPRPGPPRIGVQALDRVVAGMRTGLPPLQALDLQHGDVILAIDGVPFRGPDFSVAQTGGDRLVVLVQRGSAELRLQADITAADRQQLAEHIALGPDFTGCVVMPIAGGTAQAAGVLSGDRVVSIDGTPVGAWNDLRERVEDAGDAPLRVELERPPASVGGTPTRHAITVTPKRVPLPDYGYTTQVEELRSEVRAEGMFDAVRLGSICAIDLVKQLYVTLKRLLTGDVAAKNLGGIIQISRVSYHNTRWGLPRFLYFLALLSINLAFINVLPIPVLDGGHLMFLLIERVKGSPVSTRVLNYSQVLGLVLVLALVVFVTYNDILRLL